jgi:GAF domain-containing protein
VTEPDGLRAAVSAGVLPSEDMHRALLRSIVEVARAIFAARGASIFLLDEETDELVFEAVANPEDEHLVGRRFPSGQGIAGWVLVTRQPIVIEDVTQDPRHAKDVAEATGYAPKGLMAVPLLHEEDALGVLEVLDRPERPGFALMEMDLLSLFANQAAIALDLLRRARRANAALEGSGSEAAVVARLAETVEGLEGERRAAALRLVGALEEILRDQQTGAV